MTKHRDGQSQRVVLSQITSTSPGAVGSLPSLLNRSAGTQFTSPAVSPAARKAGPQRMQLHPHLLQEQNWFSLLSSPSETQSTAVLVPRTGCKRSAEVSLWVIELRSPLVPGYSFHLFKCPFFCKLETMTEEVSAPAITSLQQKPGENSSFELVTAVMRLVLCP